MEYYDTLLQKYQAKYSLDFKTLNWEIFDMYIESEHNIPYYLLQCYITKTKVINDEFSLEFIINLLKDDIIHITNVECIKEDIDILYEQREARSTAKQDLQKFKVKRDLLGITYCDIRYIKRQCTLFKLVPDENGEVFIPDFVTNIDESCAQNSAKALCRKIIWKHPKVFSVCNLFRGNKSIKKLDLTEFNLSRIPILNDMFYCSNLESVDFGDNDFHNVKSMEEFFQTCNNLKRVDLSKSKLLPICQLDGFLNNCVNLQELNLGQNSKFYTLVNKYNPHLNYLRRFYTGFGLMSYTTGYISTSNVTDITAGCTSLEQVFSWLHDGRGSQPKHVMKLIKLNELTGINYINRCLVESSKTRRIEYQIRTELEATLLELVNKPAIIQIDFIVDNYGRRVADRVATVKTLKSSDPLYMKLENYHGMITDYKYRLMFASTGAPDNIEVVYFNSYTMWGEEYLDVQG